SSRRPRPPITGRKANTTEERLWRRQPSKFRIVLLIMMAQTLVTATLLLSLSDSMSAANTTDATAAIHGKVVYAGPPPPKRKIIVTKDSDVCGSGIREVDQIVLDTEKRV